VVECRPHAGFDVRVNGWLDAVRQRYRSGEQPPALYHDLLVLLDEMRMVKDAGERATLRRAGQISAHGHIQAMRATRPGMMEYQVEAEILHTFIRNGARYPSYESIVAGGANACTLHYAANNARLNDGDLLLIDAGCELNGYAGDITRTFPVNGKFSPPSVMFTKSCWRRNWPALPRSSLVRCGMNRAMPRSVLVQGMLDLKLLTGSVDGVIESGAFRQFYMHGIGHMIGLDVHDVGQRKQGGQWRSYQPGMCTTIEPGLYIRPADNVPPALHNIGIRIEDDVLVTEDGHEVYTADVPKEIDAIEILMQGV
jgi:Xaa-Pro aminopeptidase